MKLYIISILLLIVSEVHANNNDYEAGVLAQEQGRIDTAIYYYSSAIDNMSTPEPFYYVKRAYCYYLKDSINKAEEDMNSAKNSPNLDTSSANASIVFYNLAVLENKLGKDSIAIVNYSTAIKLSKKSKNINKNVISITKILFNRGVTYIYEDEYDKALQDFGQVEAMNSANTGDNSFPQLLNYIAMAKKLRQQRDSDAGIIQPEKIGPNDTWVLSVGIDKYLKNHLDSLAYTVKESREFINFCEKKLKIPRYINENGKKKLTEQLILLTDSNATGEGFISMLKKIKDNISSNDKKQKKSRVWLFFSGHGTEEGIELYDTILPYDTLFSKIQEIKANQIIVIIDACFSGIINVNSGYKQNITDLKNVIFYTSTNSYSRAYDNLFATSFIDALSDTLITNNLTLLKVCENTSTAIEKKIKAMENHDDSPTIQYGLPILSNSEAASRIIIHYKSH